MPPGFPKAWSRGYGFLMLMKFERAFFLHRPRLLLAFMVGLLAVAVIASSTRTAEAAGLRVASDGGCLNVRGEASLSGAVIACVPDGSEVVSAGQQATGNGVAWTLIRWGDVIGWAASQYLSDGSAPLAPPPAAGTPSTVTATRSGIAVPLRTPPTGGLTVGLVSFVSPKALADAQPFEVTSLSVFDVASRGFVTYIPGSPVNTIGEEPLPANTAVFIRRRGDLPATLPAPSAAATTSGTPTILPAPALGASVVGLAGTGDVAALIAAQTFVVESVSVWDTPSQRWLTHIASAPLFVNTLRSGLLGPESVVFVKRTAQPGAPVAASALGPAPTVTAAPPAPAPPASATPGSPGLKTVSYGPASISFYYCSDGPASGSVGDGGGFCGYMANGQIVQPGAASCAAAYMGQRFLIVGDPLQRVYTCMDTGGAVTSGHRDIWFATSDEGGAWWRAVGMQAEILVIVP